MLVIRAGQLNSVPFPSVHHQSDENDSEHCAIQLLGVLKMRKPSNFDLQSIITLKRAAASEGGASSGGYLLSSLALDPHSLIIASTAPILNQPHGKVFNLYLPHEAIPSYKGDAFDIEYVVVEKRLSDGHLEMMMASVKSGLNMIADSQCRVLYSRDCPAVICDPQMVTIEDVERRLRTGLELNSAALKLVQVYNEQLSNYNGLSSTLQYSIKDNDEHQIAIVKVIINKSIIESITILPKATCSKILLEVHRMEAIDDLFSSSDSTAVNQKLVYKRHFDNIDFASEIEADHLPEFCLITAPIFKVYYQLNLVIDDAVSCSINIR